MFLLERIISWLTQRSTNIFHFRFLSPPSSNHLFKKKREKKSIFFLFIFYPLFCVFDRNVFYFPFFTDDAFLLPSRRVMLLHAMVCVRLSFTFLIAHSLHFFVIFFIFFTLPYISNEAEIKNIV